MKRLICIAACGLFAASCTTSDHVPEKIETNLTSKGQTENGTIGINKDGEAIVQEERDAADELRVQENTNSVLRAGLDRDHHDLKTCHNDLADPRLGGSGNLPDMPDIDSLRSSAEQKEEFGSNDKGDLKVVRKSYFRDKLAAERKYEKSIREMQKLVSKQLEKCRFTLAQARTKAGLPQKANAEGYYTQDGTWIETAQGEQTLDKSFENQARRKAKAEKKAQKENSDAE